MDSDAERQTLANKQIIPAIKVLLQIVLLDVSTDFSFKKQLPSSLPTRLKKYLLLLEFTQPLWEFFAFLDQPQVGLNGLVSQNGSFSMPCLNEDKHTFQVSYSYYLLWLNSYFVKSFYLSTRQEKEKTLETKFTLY